MRSLLAGLFGVRFDLHCTAWHFSMALHGVAAHGSPSGGSRVRSQPRPQSGGQRPQAAWLSTVEPSCRVRDGSQTHSSMECRRRPRHANNSRPGTQGASRQCPITTRTALAASAVFKQLPVRCFTLPAPQSHPDSDAQWGTTWLAAAGRLCCEPVVHSAPHRSMNAMLACEMAGCECT